MNFHRAVYTIMFAIRNKHKMEKKQRSRYYANLWKKVKINIFTNFFNFYLFLST